jgi:hypothetical protein
MTWTRGLTSAVVTPSLTMFSPSTSFSFHPCSLPLFSGLFVCLLLPKPHRRVGGLLLLLLWRGSSLSRGNRMGLTLAASARLQYIPIISVVFAMHSIKALASHAFLFADKIPHCAPPPLPFLSSTSSAGAIHIRQQPMSTSSAGAIHTAITNINTPRINPQLVAVSCPLRSPSRILQGLGYLWRHHKGPIPQPRV